MNHRQPQERHPHRTVAEPVRQRGGATSCHTSPTRGETENLPRLVAKIAGYEKAARSGGPAWPVLLYLHSRLREDNLHQVLAGAIGRCPVATAARTPDSSGPAGAVWRLLGGAGRLPLHRLGGQVDAPAAAGWADEYQTGDLPGYPPSTPHGR